MSFVDQLGAAIKAENTPVPIYGKVAERVDAERGGDTGGFTYGEAKAILLTNPALRREVMDKFPDYALHVATLGDTVWFGSYDHGGSVESIEWIVLEKDQKKLFLVSKLGLDCKPFHYEYTNESWATCSLRAWLNGEFLNTAFTKEESRMIQFTPVGADREVNIYANHGENTLDKLFLLSMTDAMHFFRSDEERQCVPTAFAEARGAYKLNGHCWWWLRTPGYAPMSYCITYVNDKGEIKDHGDGIEHADNAIRPAMWINLA